jgi:hypothetical protein
VHSLLSSHTHTLIVDIMAFTYKHRSHKNNNNNNKNNDMQGVADMCKRALREERRKIYVTPKSFLGNVSLFLSLLTKRSEKLSKDIRRYERGITILKETGASVEILKVILI